MSDVLVIDYGIVNLKNVLRGLEYVGFRPTSSADPDRVLRAGRVILPGVGAFQAGMQELRAHGLEEAVQGVASSGRPILGICLGMQMLMESSTEHGRHAGLGLIPGVVLPIPRGENEGQKGRRKVPHIGWSALHTLPNGNTWKGSCLDGTRQDAYFYFAHSFIVHPTNDSSVLAECIYEDLPIVAAIKNDNITGLQFHPERSGPEGLAILNRFRSI